MTTSPEFLVALVAMALAAFACRIGGFLMMGFVPITPRLEAALKAIPLAVMVGIVAPVAAAGRPPEIAGILAAGLAMKLLGNDLVATLVGIAAVALMRWGGL
jgi:uncharacterized membrane protein